MGGPEQASGAVPSWIEGFGAFLLLLLTLGGQAWRYIKESNKDEAAPRHMVLETAELADMQPIRQAIQKMDKLLEMKVDIEQIKRDDARILEVLERIDRSDEVEREVQARLRDERHRRGDL